MSQYRVRYIYSGQPAYLEWSGYRSEKVTCPSAHEIDGFYFILLHQTVGISCWASINKSYVVPLQPLTLNLVVGFSLLQSLRNGDNPLIFLRFLYFLSTELIMYCFSFIFIANF